MTKNDKKELQLNHVARLFFLRFKVGISKIMENYWLKACVILYWVLVLGITAQYHPADTVHRLLWGLGLPLVLAGAAALFVLAVILLATPKEAAAMSRDLRRAGVTNAAGEAPILLNLDKLPNGRAVATLVSRGVSISQYRDMAERIETAWNRRITRIETGPERNTVRIYLAPGDAVIPQRADWDDVYLDKRDFAFTLGICLDGLYSVDLNVAPHVLIAGSTGSGKTVLIKNIIHQALKKGAEVYLIDLKGGLDYPEDWKNRDCSFCAEQQSALSLLAQAVEELERRKIILAQHHSPNIEVYRREHDGSLAHILIVLDEIAELTDTTGLDKEHKEMVHTTIALLSTLARMGRAYGIHLLVGTQRPDANILPGQIKNNCDVRICGRADNTLSIIILDNADAADKIPKDSRGRFLTNDGTEFQGFWMPM